MDTLRMQQVTSNLISNAIKYSPDGGRVDVRLEPREPELVLAVTDRGLGMSPETQRVVFEPFSRSSLRDGIPGSGLGLFVVQKIVAAHGGRIEVESTVGSGSTFRVFLPYDVSRAG
jgi:signal transduction histidine kinase